MHDMWLEVGSSKISLDGIETGVEKGLASTDPITELQQEWISIAQGLDDPAALDGWLSVLEEQHLEDEHQGAIFVQKQVHRFFERQKHQLLARQASSQ